MLSHVNARLSRRGTCAATWALSSRSEADRAQEAPRNGRLLVRPSLVATAARPGCRPRPGRDACGSARIVLRALRGCGSRRAEPDRAGLLRDRRFLRRLAPRPFRRRPPRRRDGERLHRPHRDLHPARRRRADRHLGDERHTGRHGLLRAAAAEPALFLHDGLPDLRGGGGQHRQLLDRRRHPRHRPDGDRPEDGARPGDHRGRGDLGRLFRRQVLAAFRHREPGLRGIRRQSLRPYPRVALDLGPRAAAGARGVLEPRQPHRVRSRTDPRPD